MEFLEEPIIDINEFMRYCYMLEVKRLFIKKKGYRSENISNKFITGG